MTVIFSASGDKQSFHHSSRLIAPFLHWLFPNLSQHAIDTVVTFVRKCAHLTEYGVIGGLLYRALGREALALATGIVYAATDELHQYFVRGRHASPVDVSEIFRERLLGEVETSIFTSATLTAGGNFEFVRARLSLYKSPERVVFMDALPKGPTGKILRRAVRESLSTVPGTV